MYYTKKFKNYVLIGLILNVLHGIEIAQTKFYVSNPDFYPYTKYFETIPEAVYYVQHGWLYFLIFLILCFVLEKKWILVPLLFLGYILTVEIHHFIKGVMSWAYFSGMITSGLFIPLAYLYWKELILIIKK